MRREILYSAGAATDTIFAELERREGNSMTEQANFEITDYEVFCVSEKAWRARVTFTVDGVQYRETVCTVQGKEIADENYWRENCSRIKKVVVYNWLTRHVGNDKATGVLKLIGIPGDRTIAS